MLMRQNTNNDVSQDGPLIFLSRELEINLEPRVSRLGQRLGHQEDDGHRSGRLWGRDWLENGDSNGALFPNIKMKLNVRAAYQITI